MRHRHLCSQNPLLKHESCWSHKHACRCGCCFEVVISVTSPVQTCDADLFYFFDMWPDVVAWNYSRGHFRDCERPTTHEARSTTVTASMTKIQLLTDSTSIEKAAFTRCWDSLQNYVFGWHGAMIEIWSFKRQIYWKPKRSWASLHPIQPLSTNWSTPHTTSDSSTGQKVYPTTPSEHSANIACNHGELCGEPPACT